MATNSHEASSNEGGSSSALASATQSILMPGSWLGMMGGGQLGRMFCHAAQSMGYRVAVLEPQAACPAGAVADHHIQAGYADQQGLDALARQCGAVTVEFENVPADSLAYLGGHLRVAPGAYAVAIAQDRLAEKDFFTRAGVPVAPYAPVLTPADIETLPDTLFPGILKSARLGYDGKGQVRVNDREQLLQAWRELGGVPCVLEARLALASEWSVVLARDSLGHSVAYTPSCNTHIDGILAVSWVDDARVSSRLRDTLQSSAKAIADALDYVGVLCVEFFELQDGRLIANEMAPRPHNSGHYTIDACRSSQFEQQARVMAGMPLGDPACLCPSVMLNVLGDVWFDESGTMREPDWAAVLAVPGAKLHLYGKEEARHGRKMGHITLLGDTGEQAWAAARQVATILGIALEV
ncbi:5-(carboxyamino)imidazole ribonucleotide synthase [Pusillimonas sp. CC-YST705]|uniref:N5-carboxyaminoimidazole ribonucleotide synthase n=1 Tax=Mesopusillimonas faecipullorum TaxID=2755040 RepID=A0ABS8CEU7_9BURK|nr:5-(carboxyamino)imidazole ribonucleotide synthase [Mesopusillimonas faecipullorum]MCB5364582.1 5-(carboxyamino)imidazole ribonucleotide synthase [Mesopusillimonas faecipullorum]